MSAYKKTNERNFGCKIWYHTVTNTLQTFPDRFFAYFHRKSLQSRREDPELECSKSTHDIDRIENDY